MSDYGSTDYYEQALILEPPDELTFVGPFTDEFTTATLKLSNPTQKLMCYKIKTTAPKRYCVCPNSGFLEPKTAITVAVNLHSLKYNAIEENRDKFMVQSMFVPEHTVKNVDTLWRDAPPESVMDIKLRCAFVMPDSTAYQTMPLGDCDHEPCVPFQSTTGEITSIPPDESEREAYQNMRKDIDDLYRSTGGLSESQNPSTKNSSRLRKTERSTPIIPEGPASFAPLPACTPTTSCVFRSVMVLIYIIVAAMLGLYIGKFVL